MSFHITANEVHGLQKKYFEIMLKKKTKKLGNYFPISYIATKT